MIWLVLIGLLCLLASAEDVDLVTVFPACDEGAAPCEDINSALQGLRSNTTLALLEGEHTIRNAATVANAVDIKIVGNRSDPSLVRLACDSGVGLVFVNNTNLELSGFTLEKCGLNGHVNALKTFPEFASFLVFHPVTFVAVLVGNCFNFLMENVTLQNNFGFGMVGFNLIGNSRLSGLNVLANAPSICSIRESLELGGGTSGGGMFIAYVDYRNYESVLPLETTLTIENSLFADNYICTRNLFVIQYDLLSRSISTIDLTTRPYSVDGAGALTVALSQAEYYVNAFIKSCTFRNNTGLWTGSAVQLIHFESTNNSHIYLENSYFYDNGGELENTLNYFGAITAFFYVPFPLDILMTIAIAEFLLHEPSTIQVTGCQFKNNQATNGGAVSVFSFGPAIGYVQDEIHFRDCDFSNNTAAFGSAVFITEISYSAFEPGLKVFLHNINTAHNSRLNLEISSRKQVQ